MANRRADVAVTPDERHELLARAETATWFVPGDADAIVMRTFAKSQKVRNMERDPRDHAKLG